MTERARRERLLGWTLTAPALAAMVLVTAYPLGKAVWLSLHSYRITEGAAPRFIGLENYRVVLADRLWWSDVETTLLMTVVSVAAELAGGLALALVMHRIAFARRSVRTSVLVPYGLMTVVSAWAARFAFDAHTGFVNGWLGLDDFAWFSHRGTAVLAICAAEIWKTTPFVSLLLLAGLAQVPEELHEAARTDGAGFWQLLFRVTLPNMKGAILVALLFRVLDAYRIFDSVFVMTGGAQGTETVSFLAYRQMIGRTALGLGCAVSVLFFLSVVLIAAGFIRVFRVDLARARGEP